MSETKTCGNCKFFKERHIPKTLNPRKFGKCEKSEDKLFYNLCRFMPTKDYGCILFEPKI